MATYDVYAGTSVAATNWSGDVAVTPASNGQPALVTVDGLGSGTLTLDGTVAQAGDTVTMTLDVGGAPFQSQLAAVLDIQGGALFTNGTSYFLFADAPLQVGASYPAATGFGLFSAPPEPLACFVEGTRIETHRGLVAVEDLRIGDRVRTLLGGTAAPVIWTGRRQVDCRGLGDPSRGWPVRISAGAFAPATPLRDLSLSPDHAVFVDGMLIPIRCLVNDASIAVAPADRVTYWHVELPAHDVLAAEGLPAESYLDCGNRAGFEPCAAAPSWARPVAGPSDLGRAAAWPGQRAPMQAWAAHACAELVLDPARHRAVRARLQARALALGFTETSDAGLHLVDTAGRTMPAYWDGVRAIASVPATCDRLVLRSLSATPCTRLPGNGDDRRLGVAVGRLRLDGATLPLDDAGLQDGWHRVEDGFRWTNGAGVIALPPALRARVIEVTTVPMLLYWSPSARAAAPRPLPHAA